MVVISSRLRLKAILVVLVTIASLFVASARSPDAVFATLSARAAAQDAHEATLRTTPSSSEGSDGIIGLRGSIEAPKTASSNVGGGGGGDPQPQVLFSNQPIASFRRADLLSPSPVDADSAIVDPPTRARARLMVFLN
jgi:hypothetical protein